MGGQVPPNQFDCLEHKPQDRLIFDRLDPAHLGGGFDRVVNDGAFALGVFQIHAHRFENREQVGEENGRIDPENPLRAQGDFRGEIGPLAELDERHLAADIHVLGQVATSLPHDPDGAGIDRFPAASPQEAAVGEGIGVSRSDGIGGGRHGKSGQRDATAFPCRLRSSRMSRDRQGVTRTAQGVRG